jgi:hypothetical protein
MNVNKIIVSRRVETQFRRPLGEALYCPNEVHFLFFAQSSPLTPQGWVMTYK